jgi:hypothetical protein
VVGDNRNGRFNVRPQLGGDPTAEIEQAVLLKRLERRFVSFVSVPMRSIRAPLLPVDA